MKSWFKMLKIKMKEGAFSPRAFLDFEQLFEMTKSDKVFKTLGSRTSKRLGDFPKVGIWKKYNSLSMNRSLFQMISRWFSCKTYFVHLCKTFTRFMCYGYIKNKIYSTRYFSTVLHNPHTRNTLFNKVVSQYKSPFLY